MQGQLWDDQNDERVRSLSQKIEKKARAMQIVSETWSKALGEGTRL